MQLFRSRTGLITLALAAVVMMGSYVYGGRLLGQAVPSPTCVNHVPACPDGYTLTCETQGWVTDSCSDLGYLCHNPQIRNIGHIENVTCVSGEGGNEETCTDAQFPLCSNTDSFSPGQQLCPPGQHEVLTTATRCGAQGNYGRCFRCEPNAGEGPHYCCNTTSFSCESLDTEAMPICAGDTPQYSTLNECSAACVGEGGGGSMVLHYTFDNEEGTAVKDSSGNHNDGVMLDGANRVNGCMHFDGDNDRVEIAKNLDDQTFTFAAWVKKEDGGTNTPNFIASYIDDGWGVGLMAPEGPSKLFITQVAALAEFSNAQTGPGAFHHMAVTFDGSYVKFYIDGKLDSTKTFSGTFDSKGGPYELGWRGFPEGSRPNQVKSAFKGFLDDVRVYDSVLDESQIKALMNQKASCSQNTNSSSSSTTGGQCAQTEYTMTVASTAKFGGEGGGYSGAHVDCSTNMPAGGWQLANKQCVLGTDTNCIAMYCLWKKSASEGHDYVMTQAGGGYNDPSASCTGSKPASDFTLKFEGCAAKTDTGKCLTDLCLWERKGTGGNLTLTHAGSDNAAVDCKQSPPSGAPTFVDRECMFTKDPNCISDVCLFSDCDEVGFCGPECGDGIIMSPEECDDHNTQNGDGCDSQCKKGNGSSSSSSPACGNGTRNGAEECDDGNTKDGDGCSASCTDEPGYQCLAPLPFCPGNQRVLHPKVTCKKGSDGKYPLTCAPPYAAGMHLEAASQVELTYSVAGAGHCAQTRLRVNIDGTEVGVTNFIGSEISGGALSTSIQLGSVAAGDHSVTLIGEGDGNACGGVSDGLGAWAGTVTLAATADQCGDGKHAPVCGDGVCAAEEGCKFGSGKAVGECTTTAPCALDCDYGSMTVTQCTDTDNGANLSVRGTLSAKDPENQTLAFTDFCPSDKRIREFACSSPTKLSWNDLGCASCSAGQCQ